MAIFLVSGAPGTHSWCWWACSHIRNLLQATVTVQHWDSTNSFPSFSRIGSSDDELGSTCTLVLSTNFVLSHLYGRILQNKAKRTLRTNRTPAKSTLLPLSHAGCSASPRTEPSSSFHSFSFLLLVAAEGGSMPLVSGHDNSCVFWPWYWQLCCFSCVVSASFVKSTTIIPW